MIWGIDPGAAFGLFLLANAQGCPPQPVPQVEMQTISTPAQFNNSLSSAELGGFPVDTVVARHSNEIFVTGGITRGQVTTAYDISFRKLLNPVTNTACIWAHNIKIIIEYAPVVYVAREYRPGTCRYNVTMEHELRHVNTDVITLNEFLPRIQAAVQAAAGTLGVRGPVPDPQAAAHQQDMVNTLAGQLKGVLAELDSVRMQRQQQIDTRQEYMRISRACPQEQNPIALPGYR